MYTLIVPGNKPAKCGRGVWLRQDDFVTEEKIELVSFFFGCETWIFKYGLIVSFLSSGLWDLESNVRSISHKTFHWFFISIRGSYYLLKNCTLFISHFNRKKNSIYQIRRWLWLRGCVDHNYKFQYCCSSLLCIITNESTIYTCFCVKSQLLLKRKLF